MPIKLLIVDDSALMRRALSQIFETAGGFEIRTAHDGADALREVAEWRPDVVTLDINMPRMDGMTALSQIMVEHPCPVVMVSSLTQKDALPTLEALALGAVDFVAKPSGTVSLDIRKVEVELLAKVRSAARSKVRRARAPVGEARGASSLEQRAAGAREPARSAVRAKVPTLAFTPRLGSASAQMGNEPLVLIGVSTGGPRTLEDILPKIPSSFPYPILVAIHMPSTFTGHFARRMGDLCSLEVKEVTRQTPLLPGVVYVARGDADMIVARRSDALVAMVTPADATLAWHPSVDRMVESALRHVSAKALLGVQLTGMGNDGAAAMKQLHAGGGYTIAESEQSAVVFGMPKELIERGGASVVLPVEAIADKILRWAMRGG